MNDLPNARWDRLKDVFDRALDLDGAARTAFLDSECEGDADLRREVDRLLKTNERAGDFLEQALVQPQVLPSGTSGPLQRGDVLGGRFTIEQMVGAGGMGEVYRARDERLHRTVAIKVLPDSFAGLREWQKRFASEARAIAALEHPNICSLYDFVQDGDRDRIILEYLEGETLAARLKKGPLPQNEWMRIARDVCSALDYAHAHGLIHRDLKPGNVMLTNEGVKLLDFGLAKQMRQFAGSAPAQSAPTENGIIAGTVAYMSPEQAEGKTADIRSDVFSFGCVLYEMVTGARAFQGDTSVSTLAAILRGEPKRMRDIAPHAPAGLSEVIARCLKKNPEDRFSSIKELQLALRKFDSGARRTLTPRILWTFLVVLMGFVGAAIWLAAKSGSGFEVGPVTELTRDGGYTGEPTVSPDGKWIAYVSDRNGATAPHLWLEEIGSGQPKELAPECPFAAFPAFSASGTSVYYACSMTGAAVKADIYEVSVPKGDARLIRKHGTRPRPSPDGKWLAYLGVSSGGTGGQGITLLSLSGGADRTLLRDFDLVVVPTWSSDSRNLIVWAVPSAKVAPKGVDFWVVSIDTASRASTGLEAAIGNGPSMFSTWEAPVVVRWNADGRVVFTSAAKGRYYLWGGRLSTSDYIASDKPVQLTSGATEVRSGAIGGGLFVSDTFRGQTDVATLRIDEKRATVIGDLEMVTDDEAHDQLASIARHAPIGVFNSNRRGRTETFLVRFDSGQVSPVPTPEDAVDPIISDDGSVIASGVSAGGSLMGTTERVFVTSTRTGVISDFCSKCGYPIQILPDLSGMLFYPDGPGPISVRPMSVVPGPESIIVSDSEYRVLHGRVSRDAKWFALSVSKGDRGECRLFVMPFTRDRAMPRSTWIPVTDWITSATGVDWLSDQDLVFRMEEPGELWVQHLDPSTKRPVGPPRKLYHLRRAHDSFTSSPRVGSGRLVITIERPRSNVSVMCEPFARGFFDRLFRRGLDTTKLGTK